MIDKKAQRQAIDDDRVRLAADRSKTTKIWEDLKRELQKYPNVTASGGIGEHRNNPELDYIYVFWEGARGSKNYGEIAHYSARTEEWTDAKGSTILNINSFLANLVPKLEQTIENRSDVKKKVKDALSHLYSKAQLREDVNEVQIMYSNPTRPRPGQKMPFVPIPTQEVEKFYNDAKRALESVFGRLSWKERKLTEDGLLTWDARAGVKKDLYVWVEALQQDALGAGATWTKGYNAQTNDDRVRLAQIAMNLDEQEAAGYWFGFENLGIMEPRDKTKFIEYVKTKNWKGMKSYVNGRFQSLSESDDMYEDMLKEAKSWIQIFKRKDSSTLKMWEEEKAKV